MRAKKVAGFEQFPTPPNRLDVVDLDIDVHSFYFFSEFGQKARQGMGD